MARLVLAWAVLALALSGQPSTVPVTLAWDLDATHEGATWEVEADGQNVTCGLVAVTATDRRCTAQLPVGSYAIRLRGTVQGDDGPLVGGWSEPITAHLTAPGPFTITAHWESETPEPMALALSNLTSGFSTSNPATTASVSPTSGSILYVAIGYSKVGGGAYSGSDTAVPSGVMSTWTPVASIGNTSDRRGLRIYRGTGTITAGTISITVSPAGGTYESMQWSVNQVTGHDTTTPNDTAAVAAYTNPSGDTSAATGSVGTLDAGDITFAAFTHETNEDVTLESGYTQLSHTANATGLRTLTVGYHTSDTTPTASWASASGWNAAGLIINAGEAEPDPLEITTTTLPNGTVGTPYSQNLSATGGTPPYTWSVISGALPDGLSLTGNTISGTPTVVDTFNFTVEVEDDEAETDTQALSIIIGEAGAWETVVSISGQGWRVNGSVTYPGTPAEGLLLNSRMVNAIADDENATTVEDWEYPDTNTWDPDRNKSEFIAQLSDYKARGMLAFTLGLQGGWPGHVSTGDNQDGIITAFNSNGSLKSAWLDRLADVIEASDALGMVVILNLFYFGQDHRLTNEAAVIAAVDNICTWLTTTKGYTNVVIEVANESNQHYGHAILQPARVGELIEQVQGYGLLASVSYTGGSIPSNALVAASDFVLLHGNGQNPSAITAMVASVKALSGWSSSPKPIIFNEDPETQFNFDAAILAGVSWGSLLIGNGDYSANSGFQVMPPNWAVNTSAKRAFFDRAQFYARLWTPGAIIQSATNQTVSNATSVTVTLPRLPIPGTTIVGAHHTRSDSSVAPSGFSEAVAVFNATEADEGAIYHRVTPQAAGTSFVFGQSPTGDAGAAAVYEVYGIVTTSPVNQVATTGRTTSTTSISSGTTAATSGPTFALAMAAIRNTVTSPTWTNEFVHRHHVTGLPATTEAVLLTATKVVPSAGAVETTASWTTARTAMGAVATFTLDVEEAPTFQPALAARTSHVLGGGVI